MSSLPEKKVIGITGTMGAGKSTATHILSKHIPVTDCDQINANLLLPGQDGYLALKKKGMLMIDEQGFLDKKATAARVFSDTEYKKEYEQILHPLILQKMEEWISSQTEICAVEVPLLFELGLEHSFDEIWCISCSEQKAIQRLMDYRGFQKEEALARIAKQYSRTQKEENSDVVIMNDGTQLELEKKIEELLNKQA
ncbi:MAG: dephospho-CoA kinase [Ileibacterium sp.]|nr:dephospho-CoA kinase [Ileibacterium sp.]